MCSQYSLKSNVSAIAKLLNIDTADNELSLNDSSFNSHIYPHAKAPVVIAPNDTMRIVSMQYSLIPHWSKSDKLKFTTYNARLDRPNTKSSVNDSSNSEINNPNNNNSLEKIYQAPTWRKPFESQRCIVPLTGFFESCKNGSHGGNIVEFSSNNQPLLFAAGIYDKWINPESNQEIHSYAIITDEPTEFILSVGHDRQPVFLTPDKHKTWLNHKALKSHDAYDFLKSNQESIAYSVNNVRELKRPPTTNQTSLF